MRVEMCERVCHGLHKAISSGLPPAPRGVRARGQVPQASEWPCQSLPLGVKGEKAVLSKPVVWPSVFLTERMKPSLHHRLERRIWYLHLCIQNQD